MIELSISSISFTKIPISVVAYVLAQQFLQRYRDPKTRDCFNSCSKL